MRRAGFCLIVHLSAAAFLCANSPVAWLPLTRFASASPRAGARCCCATGCCCQAPPSRHCPANGAPSCCCADHSEQTTHDRPTAEPVRQPCDSSYPCCPCGPRFLALSQPSQRLLSRIRASTPISSSRLCSYPLRLLTNCSNPPEFDLRDQSARPLPELTRMPRRVWCGCYSVTARRPTLLGAVIGLPSVSICFER